MFIRKRDDVVVLVAPLHGVTATKTELRKARRIRNFQGHTADVITWSEGSRIKKRGYFRNLINRKTFTGPRIPKDDRGRIASWDVIIETRRWFKTIWKNAAKWADEAMPLKIAPERWGIEWDLRIRWIELAAIFDHPHAAIDATPDGPWDQERLDEYKKQAFRRKRAIWSALSRNLHVVAGGDLNYPPGTGFEWTPESIFDSLNMKWRRVDVTWLAWSEDLELVDVDIIPPSANGQDHGWILGTFRPKDLSGK